MDRKLAPQAAGRSTRSPSKECFRCVFADILGELLGKVVGTMLLWEVPALTGVYI